MAVKNITQSPFGKSKKSSIPTQEVREGKVQERRKKGGRPPKPDFGKFTLRMHKSLHARIKIEAKRADLKESAFISQLFLDYLKREK